MSLHRRNPKRDANEKGIRDALEAVGCEVTAISGKGAPDLLVKRGGQLWAFEVKNTQGRGNRRTDAQQQTQWPIVLTADEAVAIVLGR